jgi:hypothetical protein
VFNGRKWTCIQIVRCATATCLIVDTYVCLLLHVLIGDDDQIVVNEDDNEDTDSLNNWLEEPEATPSTWDKIKHYFSKKAKQDDMVRDAETAAGIDNPQRLSNMPIAQHYHPDRSLIYKNVKSTRQSNLTVAVEQVSIFLTNDGTVITFFQVCHRRNYFDRSNLDGPLKGLFSTGLRTTLPF